jgi:tetratricopeptide (TPR) repeat protein
LGHLKRHDIAISWLTTLLQTIHWFNPLVWYAFYQMRVDQESACDAYVLSRIKTDQSTGYANTIMGLLEGFCQNRQLPALVGILENKTQIKRRLIMIAQNKKSSKRMSIMACSLLFALGFFFFTGAQGLSTNGTPEYWRGLETITSPEIVKALQADRENAKKLPTEALKALYEAQMFMNDGLYDDAIARLNAYLATEPFDIPAKAYMVLGNCWYNKEDFEETREAFGKAYEIDPTNVVALRNYAAMTYQTERFADAAALFEKLYGIEETPQTRTLWNAASAYYQAEDLNNSKRVTERLLRLPGTPDPEWYKLIIDICYTLEEMEETEGYILEFLELNPLQSYYWHILAQIHLDKNDLLSGARALEMALSIRPTNNKMPWKTLAELYLIIGDTEKAAHYCEKAGVTEEEAARILADNEKPI